VDAFVVDSHQLGCRFEPAGANLDARPARAFTTTHPTGEACPLTSQPIIARAVSARPIAAQPIIARAVSARPIAAQPIIARTVSTRPIAAQSIIAHTVSAWLASQPLAGDAWRNAKPASPKPSARVHEPTVHVQWPCGLVSAGYF